MHIFLGDVSVAFGAASICVIVIGTPSTIFNEKTFLADKKKIKNIEITRLKLFI